MKTTEMPVYMLTNNCIWNSFRHSNKKHIIISQENNNIYVREEDLDYFGNLKEEYEKRNQDYIKENSHE